MTPSVVGCCDDHHHPGLSNLSHLSHTMASTAAAASRGRRSAPIKVEDSAEKRRAHLQRQRERRRVRAATVFDSLTKDSPNGELPCDKLEYFLSIVLHMEKLDPSTVKLVLEACGRHTQESFPKDRLLVAVERFGEYAKQHKKVDAMYEKFDKDANGELSRSEFAKALQAYEDKAGRMAHGIVVRLVVTDADLDLILAKVDADQDGQISRTEMLPALATWEEVAAMKLEEREQAACCVIL